MLDYMRRNANSWVMILLFAIIIFVFAINFGPWAGNNMSTVPYAAIVNNETISLAEFRTAYASQIARIRQFRPEYDQTQADQDGLKQMVIEQLISRELLTQLGKKHQLSIGPKTLAEEIKSRVFGEETAFNKEEYVRRINAYFQSSVAQFEEQVAKEIIAQQMADLIGTAVVVSYSEALKEYKDRNTKIALEFVKVDPSYFEITSAINPATIKQYQDAHGKEINEYYNEHLGQFVKEPEIKASHILVRIPPNSTAADKATLKEKAEKILARLKNNEDFATIAKAESEDPGTKEKGGDLGYFASGMMVEEFSKAAFALKPGEISGVVESPFGFHIIKQTDAKPKLERKLEEATTEIAELLLKKEEQNKKAKELAEFALTQFKNGISLEKITAPTIANKKASGKDPLSPKMPIADETDLFSLSSGYISKLGRIDGLQEEVLKLTMTDPTAKNVIETNGIFLAVRLKAKEEADMSKFEEQKESITAMLLMPRKRAFMQQYLSQLKAGAKITYNSALMSGVDVSS